MRAKHIFIIVGLIVIAAAIFLIYSVNRAGQDVKQMQTVQNNSSGQSADTATNNSATTNSAPPAASNYQSNSPSLPSTSPSTALTAPIDRAKERVTKKPFGIYITPQTSPVQPERFTGFHTGVDFETFADEQNVDVPIKAVCTGKLLVKRTASGYGGVAVQACNLNNQAVTIVYGHLRLSSISKNAGQTLQAGEQLGVLGTGYSSETDGERKHLHLGIHKGSTVNITGYVSNQASLSGWLNALDYL